MTKLIKLILVGIMIVPMSLNAQQDTQSFVQQYKKQDGVTKIEVVNRDDTSKIFYKTEVNTIIGQMILIVFTVTLLTIWYLFVKSLYLEILKFSLKRPGKKVQDCKKII